MLYEPINVYSAPNELTSPKFAMAFAEGCGGIVTEKYRGGVWAGFGSPVHLEGLKMSIADGHDWYYGDHGYFGKRLFYRVTKNAYQHSGRGITDHQRLKNFYVNAHPFRKTGSIIILTPQTDVYFNHFGMTQAGWIEDTTREIRKYTDRKIVIHYKRDERTLKSFFLKAWMVVGYRSMSALEAVMNGIPAVSTGECAVSDLCTKIENIEKPFYPSGEQRMDLAGVLADNQWTLGEIANGDCWRKLQGITDVQV
jgi:hypothetical protein